MANICDNNFYFSCEHNFDKWKDKLETTLNEHFIYEPSYWDNCIEGYFDSKWCFPIEVLETIFEEDSKQAIDDKVYFRCLSEEYGLGYVAMNIYKDGFWKDEQCFDL